MVQVAGAVVLHFFRSVQLPTADVFNEASLAFDNFWLIIRIKIMKNIIVEDNHLRAGRAILCGLAYGLCSRPKDGRGAGCFLLDEIIEPDQPLELPQHVVILNRNNKHQYAALNKSIFLYTFL